MSAPEHTTLPWRADEHPYRFAILDADGGLVAERIITCKSDILNARLIIRAVNSHADLLEALKAMFDRWEPDCIGNDRIMWENARRAIAKAEGSTP
jgi:hypothetical protein